MLNRTNRTLSANTNRLNLGTRKLDQNTSANNGSLTLRSAVVDHHVVVAVRAEHRTDPGFRFEGPPIMGPKPAYFAIPKMSGSSLDSSRPSRASSGRVQQGQHVALASQLVGTVVVRSGDSGTGWCDTPPLGSSVLRRLRATALIRRCDRASLAGRSARATQVPLAAS